MTGVEFGKELKKLRQKRKYPSKELSKAVGKAITYVSQLERGLIKKPDFQTCYALLSELEFPEDKIEFFLDNFEIISPKKKLWEHNKSIKSPMKDVERDNLDEKELMQLYPYLFEDNDLPKLKNQVDNLYLSLNSLIEKDITRARTILININTLTKSKKSFDFFCSLFQYDFLNITKEEKKHLISIIQEFNLSRDEIFDWEE